MVYRLKKNYEFLTVYRRGTSFANEALVLYILKNKRNKTAKIGSYSKVGVSVSKKVGNSVVRSRCKRLISESFRLNYNHINKGYDFVFIARKTIVNKTYHEVEKSMVGLLKKAGVYNDKENTN